jgi:endoglycosylceramidase
VSRPFPSHPPTPRGPRLALAAALLLAATGAHPVAEDPRFLRDEQGRALILHGINVSSSTKDDPLRMPWVEQPDVARLASDFGFNFARFLLQWDALEPSPGVYDEDYLDRVAERLAWFADAGIFVVLDMHQDVYGKKDSEGRGPIGYNGAPPWAFLAEGGDFGRDPSNWFFDYLDDAVMNAFDNFWDYQSHPELQDHYAAAWAHVAERFRDDPNVLGYDLMNEPWAGSAIYGGEAGIQAFDAGAYQAFLERCIAAIRAVDADGWIFYEPRAFGPNSGQRSWIGVLDDPREGEPRLAYFPHYYALGPDLTGVYDPDTDTSLADWAASRKIEVDAQQAPLLIGEWGTGRHVTNWRRYLEDVARMADHVTSGWAYWEYGLGGWGPVDAQRNETETAEVLARAYPQRVAGTPRLVDYDPEQRVLRVEFDAEPGVTGPTEIYVPAARHLPEGFTVSTSDPPGTWSTSWDAAREVLSYHADPASTQHALEIRPVPEAGPLAGGLAAAAVLFARAARARSRSVRGRTEGER